MFSLFLSSYGNTFESLEEFEKLWEHEPQASVSHSFLYIACLGGGGGGPGGVLPYMGYIGTCRGIGYGF